MTKEEIFTKSVGGVLAQGGASCNARMCLYRGDNQRKCAAGQLIPDDKYSPATEGRTLRQLRLHTPGYLPWDESLDDLVVDLQTAHDTAVRVNVHFGLVNNDAFLVEFKKNAQEVADKHGVKVSVDSL